jgi:hypothetical protein
MIKVDMTSNPVIRHGLASTNSNDVTSASTMESTYCVSCCQYYIGFHSCSSIIGGYQFHQPQPQIEWLVKELIRLSEENGRLKALLEKPKKK